MSHLNFTTEDGRSFSFNNIVNVSVTPAAALTEGCTNSKQVCAGDAPEPYVANTECNHESGEEGLEADIRCDLNCEKEALTERLQEIDGLLQALDTSTIRTTLQLLNRVLSTD